MLRSGKSLLTAVLLLFTLPQTSFSQDLLKAEQDRSFDLTDKAVSSALEGRFNEALELYLAADLTYPMDPVVVYSVGRCYEMLNKCEQARAFFIRSLDHPLDLPPEAQEKARQYLRDSMGCAKPLDAETEKKMTQAEEHIKKGIDQFLTSDLDGALKSFQTALEVFPTIEASLRMAQIAFIQGDICGEMRSGSATARALELPGEFDLFMKHLDEAETQAQCTGKAIVKLEAPEKWQPEKDDDKDTQPVVVPKKKQKPEEPKEEGRKLSGFQAFVGLGLNVCMNSGNAECNQFEIEWGPHMDFYVAAGYRIVPYFGVSLDFSYGMYSASPIEEAWGTNPDVDGSASSLWVALMLRGYLPVSIVDIVVGLGTGYVSHSNTKQMPDHEETVSWSGFGSLVFNIGALVAVHDNISIGLMMNYILNHNKTGEECFKDPEEIEVCVSNDENDVSDILQLNLVVGFTF